jgi:DNA-binding beta-propeller fold protein YncE
LGDTAPPVVKQDLPVVHYVIAAITDGTMNNGREASGTINIYNRETLELSAQIPLSDMAGPFDPGTAVVSPDGETLYIAVKRARSGIAVIDIPSATLKSVIPIDANSTSLVWAEGSGGVSRLLANGLERGIFVIDPEQNAVVATVPCPGAAGALAYNPYNRSTYAYEYGRAELCSITPEFTAGRAVALPSTPRSGNLVVLDNGDRGVLVAGDARIMVDLRESGVRYFLLSLDRDLIMSNTTSPDRRSIYFLPNARMPATRHELSFESTGTPQLTRVATGTFAAPTATDGLYAYVASLSTTCVTTDGPSPCADGFQVVDPYTLQLRPHNHTLALNKHLVALAAGSYVAADEP